MRPPPQSKAAGSQASGRDKVGREQPAACQEPKNESTSAETKTPRRQSVPARQLWDLGGWGEILAPPAQPLGTEWEQR